MQAATFFLPARVWGTFPARDGAPAASRAGLGDISRAGGYIFHSRAEMIPFSRAERGFRGIPGGFGGYFPRRRLHFLFPSRNDTLFPRGTGLPRHPERVWGIFPAQNCIFPHPERVLQPFSAQAATIFTSRAEITPFSRAVGLLLVLN